MTYYRFGLLGYPLDHSFSPRLHQAALKSQGLQGRYDLFPIPPLPQGNQAMLDLLERMRQGDLHGLNVTIPHKIAILPHLDELSPAARAIGAVNTVMRKGKILLGENFDSPAFLEDLYFCLGQAGLGRSSKQTGRWALLLGAGGSARAIAYGLLQDGWRVLVAARRLEQLQSVASTFHDFSGLNISLLADLPDQKLDGLRIIVNATPLGMHPNRYASPWPAGLAFPPRALVYDLVYNPAETILMAAARKAGLQATNGLGMLARQAALSFQAWTGQAVDWQVMSHTLDMENIYDDPAISAAKR